MSTPCCHEAPSFVSSLPYAIIDIFRVDLNSHKGIDLSGNAAAREDALALARDLKHGAVMPGWNWTGWFVAIVDQHGHKVDEVSIADV